MSSVDYISTVPFTATLTPATNPRNFVMGSGDVYVELYEDVDVQIMRVVHPACSDADILALHAFRAANRGNQIRIQGLDLQTYVGHYRKGGYTIRRKKGLKVAETELTVAPPSKPFPIVDLAATPGKRTVDLSWTAPQDNGSDLTGYRLEWSAESGNFDQGSDLAADVTTAQVTNLSGGVQHKFRLRAINAIDPAVWSVIARATPWDVPAQVAEPISAMTTSTAALDWTEPGSNGSPVTDYDIDYKKATDSTWSHWLFSGTRTNTTITGLDAGTEYKFRIRATNLGGDGPWSPTHTASTPAAVVEDGTSANPWLIANPNGYDSNVFSKLRAGHGTENATYFRFTPGANETGSWEIHITATPLSANFHLSEHDGDPKSESSDGDEIYAVSLTAGVPYDFRIYAADTAARAAVTAMRVQLDKVTITAPGDVRSLTLTAGTQQISATWLVPLDTGGSPITGYEVEYKTDSASDWSEHTHTGTGTSASITGLTAGETYQVRVRAFNGSAIKRFGNWVQASKALPDVPDAVDSGDIEYWEGEAINQHIVAFDLPTPASAILEAQVQLSTNGNNWSDAWEDGVFTATGRWAVYYTQSNSPNHVRVRTRNAQGWSDWTSINRAPAAPDFTINRPTFMAYGLGNNVTHDFSSSDWQDGYIYFVVLSDANYARYFRAFSYGNVTLTLEDRTPGSNVASKSWVGSAQQGDAKYAYFPYYKWKIFRLSTSDNSTPALRLRIWKTSN